MLRLTFELSDFEFCRSADPEEKLSHDGVVYRKLGGWEGDVKWDAERRSYTLFYRNPPEGVEPRYDYPILIDEEAIAARNAYHLEQLNRNIMLLAMLNRSVGVVQVG